jgi:hypothetical protein
LPSIFIGLKITQLTEFSVSHFSSNSIAKAITTMQIYLQLNLHVCYNTKKE